MSLGLAPMTWGEVFRIWRRAAPVLLLAGLLGAAAAYLLASRMTPVYEASSVLLFSRSEGANLGTAAANLGTAADAAPMDAVQRASLVRSQLEIIRGHEIVRRVIDELHLRDSPTFRPTASLRARAVGAFERLTGITTGPAASAADGADPDAQIVRAYLDRLVTRNDPDSYILRLTFRGPDPVEAAAIANAHVAAYRAWLREQQTTAIEGSYAWLTQAVESARARVQAAEAAVQRDRSASMLVSVDGRTALDQATAQISTELATAQADLVRSEARAREIRRMRDTGQFAALAAMSGAQNIVELRDRYAAAEAEVASSRVTLGTNNPVRRAAEATSRQLNTALQAEIQALLQSELSRSAVARDTVARLTETLDQLKTRMVGAESARARLANLEGEAEAERQVYIGLLQRLRGLDNVAALSRSAATLLSPAEVPPVASSPRKGVFTAFGFVLFAGFAAGGVVWRQGTRNVIRHTDDAIELGVRCLAVMPELERDRRTGQLNRRTPFYSFFLQELRALSAQLVHNDAQAGRDSVSLTVTSPLPGDGKSTFCAELGRCAALNGVPTLIVSADRKPDRRRREAGRIEELEPGLPLYGVALGVEAIFRRPDAQSLIESYKRDYGMVIIDTPPTSAMAEGLLLAPVADATIVLARVDRTPRSLLLNVVRQIEKTGGRVAGAVVTFARLDSRRGLRPGDRGYYFSENSSYHDRLASSGRLLEHGPDRDGPDGDGQAEGR
ncbi:MAG TPA: hypothetical protein VE684_13605 [Crenalkalicoccus sp.]|nr:hypothetical protein [Crenalkalicoccus sp.]